MDIRPLPQVPIESAGLELEAVLISQTFKRSSRLSRLLKYLGEAFFNGKSHQVNEYSLAMEVFDKGSDFSPSEDTLVRVEARELRRRLNEYYQTEGYAHTVQIEFPKGSYALAFSRRNPDPAVQTHFSKNAKNHGLNGFSADDYAFYADFLDTDPKGEMQETLLVLSNPWVLNYAEGVTNSPAYITHQTIAVPPELVKLLQPYCTTPADESPNPQLHPTNHQNTGIGEAACAFHIGRLLHVLNRPVRLSQSRFLTWEMVRQHPIILLGSPFMHPWTHRNMPKRGYVLHPFWIEDLCHGKKEPAKYEPRFDKTTSDLLEDYGLITFFTSPSGFRQVIVAGITSPATQGVGEFFCNAARMKQVHEKVRELGHGKKLPLDFQILLKIKIEEYIPIETSLVTCRVLDPA